MPAWNSKAHLYKAEAIRRVEQGEFKDDLAKEFGVAVGTMHQWTLGVRQKGRREYKVSRAHPDEMRQLAIKLVTEGARVKAVANTLNIWPSTIDNWLKDAGILGRVNAIKASREEAISRVSQGESKAAVAASLGIGYSTIFRWTKDTTQRKIIPDATKREVARRAESGEAKNKISRELGINLTTINELTKHVRVHEISQELKDEFIRRVKLGEPPIQLARELKIPVKRYHRWRTANLLDVPVSDDLMRQIAEDFREGRNISDVASTRKIPVYQVKSLKRVIRGNSPDLPNSLTYSAEVKQQAVCEAVSGKKVRTIAEELGASYSAVKLWIKAAADRGEVAMPVTTNKIDDADLNWLTQQYPELEDWRKPLASWRAGQVRSVGQKITCLSNFVTGYLTLSSVPKTMAEMLQRGTALPNLLEELIKISTPGESLKQYNVIRSMIDYVLAAYFSEDPGDGDAPAILPGYRNPFPKISVNVPTPVRDESVHDVLPYGYIVELRERLASGPTFRDWKLAQSAMGFETITGSTNSQTDWFEVTEDQIDKEDSNCVWRIRQRQQKAPVLEMWSPVRWVAVLVKLQTVARTGMVRMLDSGESDTWRYQKNSFVPNNSPLAKVNGKKLWQQGVFRRNPVNDHAQAAILYFNTNKTNDWAKAGPDKGYECPWPMFDNISDNPYYWLETLRDWQERYNPIKQRTSWQTIPANRVIAPKSDIAKAAYPDTCFLFRTPETPGKEAFPVSNTAVDNAWRNLLNAFDKELAEKGVIHPDGSPVRLSVVVDGKTKFPLHGLRVSLITSLVLDGGIAPELMMKIVGHSRLMMLLYYTKPGTAKLRDALKGAAERINAQKEVSVIRFLTEPDEQEMQARVSFNADDWRSVIPVNPAHRNPAGWMLMHDGVCLAGGNTSPLDGDARIPGCHNGGPLRKQSTNEYGPVPGGPMNCSRCRWKAAEKHHGPGLVATFNNQAYHLHQAQETALKHSEQLTILKKEKARAEGSGAIFKNMSEIKAAERHYEAAMLKLSDTAASLAATHSMILRVKDLPDSSEGRMILAVAGDIATAHAVLEDTDSELLQLSGVCNDVELYPNLNAGTAIYRRSQLLDAALRRDGVKPFFMTLSESDQLAFGNAFLRKLAEAANFENPILGLRLVVNAIDTEASIEASIGIKLRDALPYDANVNAVTIKIMPKGGRRDKN